MELYIITDNPWEDFTSELLPDMPAGWRWAISCDRYQLAAQKLVKGLWTTIATMTTANLYRGDGSVLCDLIGRLRFDVDVEIEEG